MLKKTKPWWIGCWTLELWFHPFCWRFRWGGSAEAGREWCAKNDAVYRWISIGPFTISERYLQ